MPLWFAEILQEHKLGHDVAVVRRSRVGDRALLFETARHAVECLIGQFVGSQTVPAVEVRGQPAAHLEVPFATGIRTLIKPIEQLAERGLGWGPVLLQRCGYDCRVSPGFPPGLYFSFKFRVSSFEKSRASNSLVTGNIIDPSTSLGISAEGSRCAHAF